MHYNTESNIIAYDKCQCRNALMILHNINASILPHCAEFSSTLRLTFHTSLLMIRNNTQMHVDRYSTVVSAMQHILHNIADDKQQCTNAKRWILHNDNSIIASNCLIMSAMQLSICTALLMIRNIAKLR